VGTTQFGGAQQILVGALPSNAPRWLRACFVGKTTTPWDSASRSSEEGAVAEHRTTQTRDKEMEES